MVTVYSVDVGHLLAVLGEDDALLVVAPERVRGQKQRRHQHDGGQRHVDQEQQRERAHDLEDADEQVLRPVMGQLRDVEQVGDQLAHHLAGVVAIVIGEAQALVLLEQVHTHVGLHARAHDVTPAGDEVLAGRAHAVQHDEQERDPPKRADDSLRRTLEEVLREEAQELGERQVDAGQHRRAHEILRRRRAGGRLGFARARLLLELFQGFHAPHCTAPSSPERLESARGPALHGLRVNAAPRLPLVLAHPHRSSSSDGSSRRARRRTRASSLAAPRPNTPTS